MACFFKDVKIGKFNRKLKNCSTLKIQEPGGPIPAPCMVAWTVDYLCITGQWQRFPGGLLIRQGQCFCRNSIFLMAVWKVDKKMPLFAENTQYMSSTLIEPHASKLFENGWGKTLLVLFVWKFSISETSFKVIGEKNVWK